MAFKLTKFEHEVRDELISKLNEKRLALIGAVVNFNDEMAVQKATLKDAEAAYNSALNETQQFIDEIASRAEDEISEKSDKWQESDNGQAAASWQSEWADASSEFEPIDLDYPEEFEPEIEEHGDILDNLSTEFNP